MNRRVERLRARLDENGLDAALISNAENRRYLSGFTGSSAWLLISRDDAVIATDFRYWEQAEAQATGFTLFRAKSGPDDPMLRSLLSMQPGKKVGFEGADVSYAVYQTLKKLVRDLPEGARPELVATKNLVESLRIVKEAEEIAALQAAVDLGDAAFEAVAERIEPGWTERQVAWEIEKNIREHGGDGLSFDTIIAAGPWGAMPHAYPRERAIEAGEGVVIDMGVRLNGYMSDLTRTIFLGKPDEQFRKIYDIVLTAQLTAEELIVPGMTGEEAHNLAHRVIEEAGYGEDFGHGLGHGVGLQVHESPRVARTSKDTLGDGMVFTVEPGIYITEWGGVRIEDMVVMEKGRVRVMSHAPKLRFAGG